MDTTPPPINRHPSRKTLRNFALTATLVWIFAITSWTTLSFCSIVFDTDLVWNPQIVSHKTKFLAPLSPEEFIIESLLLSLLSGLCFPTIPFLLLMLPLAFLYFRASVD